MAQHLSKEKWTAIEGKRNLVHIETSTDSEVAGRHICSIVKKDNDRVINLVMLAPELLDLAYTIIDINIPFEDAMNMAHNLIKKYNVHRI